MNPLEQERELTNKLVDKFAAISPLLVDMRNLEPLMSAVEWYVEERQALVFDRTLKVKS